MRYESTLQLETRARKRALAISTPTGRQAVDWPTGRAMLSAPQEQESGRRDALCQIRPDPWVTNWHGKKIALPLKAVKSGDLSISLVKEKELFLRCNCSIFFVLTNDKTKMTIPRHTLWLWYQQRQLSLVDLGVLQGALLQGHGVFLWGNGACVCVHVCTHGCVHVDADLKQVQRQSTLKWIFGRLKYYPSKSIKAWILASWLGAQ